MNGGLQMRLLVVEYEKVLREALVNGLKIKEYAVDAASDGEQADVLAYTVQYDLIILEFVQMYSVFLIQYHVYQVLA